MEQLHSILYKLVVHPVSNKFIGDFQKFCGVDSQNESYKTSFLYWYFRFFSMTGEELYSLMPLLFWLSPPLAAGYILNFGFICTTSQVSKDIFQLPRPPAGGCGNIVRLEKHHGTEYGMPSTHISGALLPLSVLLNLSRLGTHVPQSYYWIAYFHIISLGLSRLYLGVHSPMDLAGGLIIGLPLMYWININETYLEDLLIFNPTSILINLIFLYLFIYHYPLTNTWTASYGTGAQFFATYFGVVTAIWYAVNINPSCWNSLQYTSLYYQHTSFHDQLFYQLIGVGLAICVVAKVAMKSLPLALFTALYRKGVIIERNKGHLKDAEGNIVPLSKLYCLEIPSRLLSYGALAWSVFVFTPLAWRYLNLIPSVVSSMPIR